MKRWDSSRSCPCAAAEPFRQSESALKLFALNAAVRAPHTSRPSA